MHRRSQVVKTNQSEVIPSVSLEQVHSCLNENVKSKSVQVSELPPRAQRSCEFEPSIPPLLASHTSHSCFETQNNPITVTPWFLQLSQLAKTRHFAALF